ncbi:MAG: DUF1499 domain-containing protein [Yoonia sp.]|jgi:hypothetical protein
MRILYILIIIILGFAAYVRLTPTDPARWNVAPQAAAPGDTTEAGGFLAARRITGSAAEVLQAFEQRALATPRTTLIAGSVNAGLLTFQTRSLLWGFPDYTTVTVNDDLLIVYGRLRFGGSDMGVNQARILGWLETLGPLTEPL